MKTNLNITQTPIAPYINLLNGMSRNEKIAVVSYLVESIPNIEIVENESKQSVSPEDEVFLPRPHGERH